MLPTPVIDTSATTGAFAADPAQVRVVRAFVKEHGHDCPNLEDMLLAVAELAANAIEHSGTPANGTIWVALMRAAGTIRLEVTDEGQGGGTPHLRRARANEEGGRGLQIVDALASKWGFTRTRSPSGVMSTTTWCEFEEVIP